MSRSFPIADFRPQWLAEGDRHRYQMGVSFTCPRHGEPCRLEFWFANPADGDLPATGKPKLYWRMGAMLIELTLEPLIHVLGHWRGWVNDGRLYPARGALSVVPDMED